LFAVLRGRRAVPVSKRYDLSKFALLVADDNEHMRRLVRSVLLGVGVGRVAEAADGSEALVRLKRERFELVLVDWMMQPMDGYVFVKTLRADGDNQNTRVPVIMMTGHAEREKVEGARDVGANEFLVKPLKPDTLIGRVIAVIDTPRAYVKAPGYVGPDRRRRSGEKYEGPRRRELDQGKLEGPS